MRVNEKRPEIPAEVKDRVVEFVREADRATIPLIRTFLRENGLIETDGVVGMSLGKSHPDVLFWSGMSFKFAQMLQDLCAEKRLYLWPSDVFENRRQGGSQRLPVITFIPRGPLGKPHWYPICYRVEPMPEVTE